MTGLLYIGLTLSYLLMTGSCLKANGLSVVSALGDLGRRYRRLLCRHPVRTASSWLPESAPKKRLKAWSVDLSVR